MDGRLCGGVALGGGICDDGGRGELVGVFVTMEVGVSELVEVRRRLA